MPKLGVNIDHVATLRQLRLARFPDVVRAARECENAGADSIVAHLREDRRHIQDADVRVLRRAIRTKFNLEMSVAPEIVRIASEILPDQVTLVPEKRQELTTEGGLDAIRAASRIAKAIGRLRRRSIPVSLFIEPDIRQIKAAKRLEVEMIEIHTGQYADSKTPAERKVQFERIKEAVFAAGDLGLTVNAGHGLDYGNTAPVAYLKGIHELNIGYAIVCQAVFVGLAEAVRQMKKLIG